ncbi:MAG: HAD-IIB family hydrolase [Lachnospiraceae bacterium]
MTDRYWIAVDMDGTLLNSRGQISERTCAVLQKCLDQGHHVLPATGRALPLLPEKIKNLSGISYAVLGNGSVVWDWKKTCALYKKCLPEGSAEQILKDVREMYRVHQEKAGKESRYYAEVISDGKVYADSLDREYFLTAEIEGNFAEYMLSNHAYVKRLEDQSEILKSRKDQYLFEDVYFKENPGKWQKVKGIYNDNLSSWKCGICSGGINKGRGLHILKERLAIPKEQIIAIGDNENDVEMFRSRDLP